MSTVAVDQIFAALSDMTRRQLLERLAEQGPASASAVSQDLPISRQAIAKHLQILEKAGLVTRTRQGKEVCFKVEPHQIAATGRWMQRMADRWDPSALAAAQPRFTQEGASARTRIPPQTHQLTHTIQ